MISQRSVKIDGTSPIVTYIGEIIIDLKCFITNGCHSNFS